MMKQTFFLLVFLLSAHIVFGCSIQQLPLEDNPSKQAFLQGKPLYSKGVSKPTYYVFIGEIVGIVKVAKNEVGENRMAAEGLKVKVTENIYSPQLAAYFEVFPLRMYTDCSSQGQTGLERVFPIGSQVRVVAFDATIYKKQSVEDSISRLETTYYNHGSIVRNDLKEGFRASANSVFDYSGFNIEKPTITEEIIKYESKVSLLKFELQKDLARLTQTTQKTERLNILKRLIYYPFPYELPFRTLANTYLKPGKELQSLEIEWEQHKKEITSRYK
jgi:hypothetical protein